jgi:hypothetical protein
VTANLTYSENEMLKYLAFGRSDADVETRIVATGTDHSVRLALRALAAGIRLRHPKERMVVQLSLRAPHGDALHYLKLDHADARYATGLALNAQATLMMRLATLLRIVSGDSDGLASLAQRRVRIYGDVELSHHVLDCFKKARSAQFSDALGQR